MAEDQENNSSNDGEEDKKNNSKGSKNKKDLFSGAIRSSVEGSNMADFVSDLESNKPASGETRKEDPAADKTSKSGNSVENNNENDEKKELSGAGQKRISLSKMEENKLKKIDPKYITKSDIKYEDGGGKGRVLIIAAIAFLAILGIYLLFFTGGKNQSKILLATSDITNSKEKPKEVYEFTLGKPLYIMLDAGDSLGVDRIQINIVEQKQGADTKASLSMVGSYTFSVKPTWETVSTHFQKDYFAKKGDYVISISKPNGTLIASQKFKIN